MSVTTVLVILAGCAGGEDPKPERPEREPREVEIGPVEAVVNPDLVTEVVVTATLDVTAELTVSCEADLGPDAPQELHVVASTAAQEHTVFVRGLAPDTTYDCSAVAEASTQEFTVTTGSLPEDLLLSTREVVVHDPDAMVLGYTAFNTVEFVAMNKSPYHFLLVVDARGIVRWYKGLGDVDAQVAFEYLPNREAFSIGGGMQVLVSPQLVDLSGNEILSITQRADHETLMYKGDFWVASLGCILQVDADEGTQEWRWCQGDSRGRLDERGINSLEVHEQDGALKVYGGQQGGAIFKVDYDTGELDWVFQRGVSEIEGLKATQEFDWTHDVNVVDDCEDDVCLSYYDNGLFEESRAVIVGIDESTGTARWLRSWTEPGWYEPRLGGLEVLENGNFLIAKAHMESMQPESTDTALIEVTPEGEVVWRLEVGPPTYTTYRARRIDGCDIFNNVGYCPSALER